MWYDEDIQPYYPFTDDNRAIIKNNDYEAIYTAKNEEGKTRNVAFADQLDSEEDFIEAIEVTGEDKPVMIQYDTTTFKERTIVQLGQNGNLIGLRKASISGRAIISETNYSIFVKDKNKIVSKG